MRNCFIRLLLTFLGLVFVSGCTTLSLIRNDEIILSTNPTINDHAVKLFAHVNQALATKDYPQAEHLLSGFIEDYPDFASPYTNLGIVYLATGRQDLALDSFQQALVIQPNACEALVQIGLIQRKRREFKLAERAYMECIFVDPDFAPAFVNLGILLEIYLGRLPEALSAYERYQSLQPNKRVAVWILDLSRRVGIEEQLASGGLVK